MSSSLIDQMPLKYQKRIAEYILEHYEEAKDQDFVFNLDFKMSEYKALVEQLKQ